MNKSKRKLKQEKSSEQKGRKNKEKKEKGKPEKMSDFERQLLSDAGLDPDNLPTKKHRDRLKTFTFNQHEKFSENFKEASEKASDLKEKGDKNLDGLDKIKVIRRASGAAEVACYGPQREIVDTSYIDKRRKKELEQRHKEVL